MSKQLGAEAIHQAIMLDPTRTDAAIAGELGISRARVQAVRRKYGHPPRRRGGAGRPCLCLLCGQRFGSLGELKKHGPNCR